MTYRGYRGGCTLGGTWGCGAAVLVGPPLLDLAILISASGDCIPDAAYNRDMQWHLILGALTVAVASGIVVRLLINRLARGPGEDGSGQQTGRFRITYAL